MRRLAALALLVAFAMARPAFAVETPDAATLERLRTEAMKETRFRVITRRGEHYVAKLNVDAEGAMIREGQARPALIVTPGAAESERRASWSEIERIDAQRSHAIRGGVIGGVLGGGLGLWLHLWIDHNFTVDRSVLFVPLGVALGAGTGALIGGVSGWRTLHP